MQAAIPTRDEKKRLAALHELRLLDTSAEKAFDDITQCVKSYFDVSICLVSLVDSNRQWFKSKQGLDVCETDRSISFCGHAIQANSVFVIEDTLQDARFTDNPLVTSAPHIRFYAGYPLLSETGFRLGTLCIIDSQPRSFNQRLQAHLANFGKVVEGLIRQRSTAHLLKQFAVADAPDPTLTSMPAFAINSKFKAALLAVSVAALAMLLTVYSEGSAFHNAIYGLTTAGIASLTYLLLRLPIKLSKLLQRISATHRRGELRFKDAIEALPDGFVIFDDEQKVVVFNQKFLELYQPIADHIVVGTHYKALKDHARHAGMLAPGPTIHIDDLTKQEPERAVQLSDGRWIKITERPMQDGGIVGFHSDITELKHYEEQMLNAKQKAEQANSAKSQFLANISHEIRTPLNGILGLQDVLLEDSSLTAQQKFYLSTMQQSSHNLLQILNDILDISKMEAGKLTLQSVPFALDSELQSACDLMRPNAEAKALRFSSNIPADIPLLQGDAGRIRQMVLNLLSNAIKFTDEGAVSLTASYAESNAQTVLITLQISDSGIGIAPDQVEALLQPFIQADNSASKRFGGTGLGLAICHTLVSLMQGSLHIHSNTPQGTTVSVTFTLPIAQEAPVVPTKTPQPAGHNTNKIKVLLADDDETNRLVVTAILENADYIVDVVSDGQQAIQAASKTLYDIILMDIYMPELDGLSAAKAIRHQPQIRQHTPIIAFTANAMEGDKEHFLAAGMDGYIAKPVDKTQLLQLIASHTLTV